MSVGTVLGDLQAPQGREAVEVGNATPVAREATDEDLLLQVRTGDAAALGVLYDRYARLFMGIGLRVLGERGEAEEIVQEVFLYIYRRAGLYNQVRGPANKWMAQVAYHRALDRRAYLRRRGFYAVTEPATMATALIEPSSVEGHVETKLAAARLEKAFSRLPQRQRQALELFYFQGLEFDDIAVRLGEPVSNIRHHYYRGIERLRKSAVVLKMRR